MTRLNLKINSHESEMSQKATRIYQKKLKTIHRNYQSQNVFDLVLGTFEKAMKGVVFVVGHLEWLKFNNGFTESSTREFSSNIQPQP